jgi:chromosome segregation ATPase
LKNNSESNDNCKDLPGARNGRSAEKEIELQNQLLDLQESYTALSQRHAKLISEMTKARDSEQAPPSPTAEYADSAVERLKRSNSFAEAVEQVVLEYEKTIQSLETSLSSTRSSLSNSESSLLEKESKLAYVETLNQQLQTRLHKMIDRESSTETYLHDLEMKLSGHTTGEEKNAAIITELKNEIARLRENETGCEDYISTLEERLAESEQDQELLQREIARLEHVIERQRSLGKLDNLLLELDSIKEIKENGTNGDLAEHKSDEEEEWSSTAKSDYEFSEQFVDGAADEPLRGTRSPPPPPLSGTPPIKESPAEDDYVPSSGNLRHDDVYKYEPHSPAQSQFVADKLESVQQELFDLKVEHEQTITEFDQMNANYEVALRNLASLQEQVDEMRRTQSISAPTDATSPPESPISRQDSFLVDTEVGDLKESEARPLSLRSLSSGPSSAGESTTPIDSPITDTSPHRAIGDAESKIVEETLCREIEALKRKHKKEQERLHQQLRQSREQLADLKSVEYINSSAPLIRRKSNQSLAVLDRAQRAFASLRRIATEYLADQPDVLENFNLNIEGALQELHNRSKRISELENDITVLRRDLETKNTMIAGLTRERTSIQSSPMDISVVAVMERRIEESEGQLHRARLLIAEREHELASAKQALESRSDQSQSEAVSLLEELTNERRLNAEQASKIAELQSELEMFRHSQTEALNSLQQSKEVAERNHREELAELKEAAEQHELEIRTSFDKEMGSYQEKIELLQKTISENKQTIDFQCLRVSELEKSQAELQEEMSSRSASASEDELKKHQELVAALDRTIAESKEQIVGQQVRLETLEQSYHDTVEQLETLGQEKEDALDALKQAKERAVAEAAAIAAAHEKLLTSVQNELAESKQSLAKLQTSYDEANSLIVTLESEKAAAIVDNAQSKEVLEREIGQHKETIASHATALQSLHDTQEKREKEMQALAVKEKKHTRLLEDLEQQLTLTFDRNQESSARLASITKDYKQATQELSESQSVIDGLNVEITKLKVCPASS